MKVVNTFRTVAQAPTVTSGRILNYDAKNKSKPITVYSWWQQRCLKRGKSIKYQQIFLVNSGSKDVTSLMPSDSSSEIMSSFSPNKQILAVIRDVPSQENGSKKFQHLELWDNSHLNSVADLTALDAHGDVYADSEFGCFEWSPCENKLLYVAEKKKLKSEPFYKEKPQNNNNDSGSGDTTQVIKGEEYVYKEEWGEQLVGKHQPVVVVYNLQEEKIVVLEGIPDNFSPGQAVWVPDGGIVGVVWENEPRRLGLMFCTNRLSYIFHLLPDGTFRILSEKNNNAVRSPRFSPDGKKLVWLERAVGGAHHGAHRLVKYCWLTGQVDIIIDIVKNKLDGVDPLYFRGLFNQSLPQQCWSSDNVHIILSTPGPTSIISCLINSDTKTIMLIKPPDHNSDAGSSSIKILDFKEDVFLCSRSNLKCPSSLVIGKLLSISSGEVDWIPITELKCLSGLDQVESVTYYTKASTNISETVNEINALYLKPPSDPGQKIPVIVYPHGGPHGNFVNSFSFAPAFFALLGYGVIMVNYRGSTGLGQDYVDFLLGKIGDSDVKDVHQVAEELCNSSNTNFDPSRKVLFGGSHGGFLVTHLSGQYPESYKVVVTLNPVTNVSSMTSVTDIPDWCSVESGNPFSPLGEITKEDLNKMYDASPVRYAHKVVAPTLLLLGKKDLRVPCSEGLQYFHRLKARKIKTKVLMYDDNHPLSQVPIEMDATINSALWFNEHLNIAQE